MELMNKFPGPIYIIAPRLIAMLLVSSRYPSNKRH